MKFGPSLAIPAYVVVSLSLLACADAPELAAAEDVSAAEEALTSHNALTSNALTSNALTSNALTSNALTSNALTAEALTSNALTAEALRDPRARELLRYVVSCALAAEAHIDVDVDGSTYRFDGGLGLAKGWATKAGTCDDGCKAWVSACVLARVNYRGERVGISVRGERAELAASPIERAIYRDREASYYGDIFSTPGRYRACLSPGADEIPRVCGPSLKGCVIDVVGSCDLACDKVRDDGSFPNCRDGIRDLTNKFPPGVVRYPATVTVFLQ